MEQAVVPESEQARETQEIARDREGGEPSPASEANSGEAHALRAEIVRVGHKLWDRQYVDGNGGNISVRLGSQYVLCTPTMISKGDLTANDICLSDLEGNILVGDRLRTSEFLLHLAIYRSNPRARAVVHCHPPYATGFAITGATPPIGLVTEYEIFIGPAAVAPYETPGTQAFADTVLPFVENHNTIVLSNHGLVCWSDTATHAEWLVEIFETYCKTYLISQQIGKPLTYIPQEKIAEILALKRRLGFPDARLGRTSAPAETLPNHREFERFVQAVIARLKGRA